MTLKFISINPNLPSEFPGQLRLDFEKISQKFKWPKKLICQPLPELPHLCKGQRYLPSCSRQKPLGSSLNSLFLTFHIQSARKSRWLYVQVHLQCCAPTQPRLLAPGLTFSPASLPANAGTLPSLLGAAALLKHKSHFVSHPC